MKNLVAAQRRYDREEPQEFEVEDWEARITAGVRREIEKAKELVSKTRVDAAADAKTIPPV